MNLKICVSHPDDKLEEFRPVEGECSWQLVTSGFWSQSRYHGGHVAYFITNTNEGVWILDRVERNTCLDGVTEEDVAEGALDDDQLQAMWGMTLQEAQDKTYDRIVAVCENPPNDANAQEMAYLMYNEVFKNDAKAVVEPDNEGLIEFDKLDPDGLVRKWFKDFTPSDWEFFEFDTMDQLVNANLEAAKEQAFPLSRVETENYIRSRLADYRDTFLEEIFDLEDSEDGGSDEEVRLAQRSADHLNKLLGDG